MTGTVYVHDLANTCFKIHKTETSLNVLVKDIANNVYAFPGFAIGKHLNLFTTLKVLFVTVEVHVWCLPLASL